MRRQFVVGFLVLALSAAAVASAGAVGRADGRSCTTQRFVAVIQALGTDGVALKFQGRDRAVTLRLLARTQIRKQDRPVPRDGTRRRAEGPRRSSDVSGRWRPHRGRTRLDQAGRSGRRADRGRDNHSSQPGATGTACRVRTG